MQRQGVEVGAEVGIGRTPGVTGGARGGGSDGDGLQPAEVRVNSAGVAVLSRRTSQDTAPAKHWVV